MILQDLIPWMRSPTHPHAVFVMRESHHALAKETGRHGCSLCIFHAQNTGCSGHRCAGGVWLTEIQAATLRLES